MDFYDILLSSAYNEKRFKQTDRQSKHTFYIR